MSHLASADWEVLAIREHKVAVHFLRSVHYAKGAANTSTYRHGLYRKTESWPFRSEASGVALWMPPTRVAAESVALYWQGVLCLSRLAVAPDVPTNGASFLLGASMRMIDRKRWPVLLTYADTAEGHTGAIYLATNWTCLGEVASSPGDSWTAPDGTMRGRKRGPKTLTSAEMLAMGCMPRPSQPKIKFVHYSRSAKRFLTNHPTV